MDYCKKIILVFYPSCGTIVGKDTCTLWVKCFDRRWFVIVQERSTWAMGKFSFINNFLYFGSASCSDYRIASGHGPLVLFSCLCFYLVSVDPFRGHPVYVRASFSLFLLRQGHPRI